MDFRIADTFTQSLARLSNEHQRAAKTSAFDLQVDPTGQGLNLHRVERARDPHFWSVRASDDIRLIVHKTASSLLLCYVDHHDPAYRWAERRKIERHPTTGAAQLVEVRETVHEVAVPRYVAVDPPAPAPRRPFEAISAEALLAYGVPPEWLDDVHAATEDTLLELADHLPLEAAEALLDLAVGQAPRPPSPARVAPDLDPFDHPDARRRFRVMHSVEELERALEAPWERWAVFLHPSQRDLVERSYGGPARVSGSAGTGKTIVALHRATHLARRHPLARVLVTTRSDALANALKGKLRHLVGNEPAVRDRIAVETIAGVGRRLHADAFGEPNLVDDATLRALMAEAAAAVGGLRQSPAFLLAEWSEVVDAYQVGDWEAYRDVPRLGRKTRLGEAQRRQLWAAFERLREALASRGLTTPAAMLARVADDLGRGEARPFDFAVVDEAQDVAVPELRFLAALGAGRPDGLFFAGDLGQRIFQPPFSWKSLGVDIRGRSQSLKINYRTSHQIRRRADRLLAAEIADVDGNAERRDGTVSVFNGPEPTVATFPDAAAESAAVGRWLAARRAEGVAPDEIGVFVRSPAEIPRARRAVEAAGLLAVELDDRVEPAPGSVSIATMHLAKGLEFRAVAVMACDDEVIPSQERIEAIGDEADLEEVHHSERHLFYVACTRARDHLCLTGVEPASEFLKDIETVSR